jgi:hypothetical protein
MSNLHQLTMGGPVPLSMTSLVITSYTFVNTTDQVEWIFQAPDDAGAATITITRLGYRLTSVTGTSPVMKISLQGVDGSGNPDGVIKGGGSPASATFTPAGSATWNWVTLDNAFTVNRGDFLAIVIAYSSGTLSGAATAVIGHSIGNASNVLPYAIQNVAGVRTRQALQPLYGFGSAGKAFGVPLQTLTQSQYSTTTEKALRFIFDPSQVQSYKVAGLRLNAIMSAAAKSNKVMLYQGTTVLQTLTWDTDVVQSTGATRAAVLWFQDAALATLVGGQEYRISVQPQDASNNFGFNTFDVAAAADLEALPGGQQWYFSTRATAGATAWTDVLTSRPMVELIVSDWTAPPPGLVMAA